MVAAVSSYPIAPVPIRRDTAERWQRASERAHLANVQVTVIDDLGTYRVTSATCPGVSYESDGIHCTCQAADHGDPVCLHRAAVRDYLESQKLCTICGGTGWDHQSIWDWAAGGSVTISDGPCSCQSAPESAPSAPLPSEMALAFARAHMAETIRICNSRTDEEKREIRAAHGIPETCAASPERIAEFQQRLDEAMERLGEVVQKLKAEGYFDQRVSA